jgi:hypothetical protein
MRRAGAIALVLALLGGCERHDVPLVVLPPRLVGPDAHLPAATAATIDPGYVGPEACAECHGERVEAVRRTSHFNTSAVVEREQLVAPVEANVHVSEAAGLHLDVAARGDELWQQGIDDIRDERMSRRMDVVIGSGKLAQTFLTWQGDRLYELPATWFAAVGWRNSPGYFDDRVDFARPVPGQCLECHALWAQPGQPELVRDNAYVGKIYWGVTCEKCHGPGREHVAWARLHPKAEHGEHIVVPSDLPRARRDDVCLLCHSQRGAERKPVFSFRPGDDLREHYAAPAASAVAAAPAALHSFDQGDRLAASRCFQASGTMSCITCHNPHHFERGDDEAFSARCLGCHDLAKLSQRAGDAKHEGKQACVGCHMPRRGTEAERRPGAAPEPRAQMRDHRIGIY